MWLNVIHLASIECSPGPPTGQAPFCPESSGAAHCSSLQPQGWGLPARPPPPFLTPRRLPHILRLPAPKPERLCSLCVHWTREQPREMLPETILNKHTWSGPCLHLWPQPQKFQSHPSPSISPTPRSPPLRPLQYPPSCGSPQARPQPAGATAERRRWPASSSPACPVASHLNPLLP